MSQYRRGRDWEYEVKERLERAGWTVFRSAGSKPCDLITFRPHSTPLWVECKVGRKPSQRETERLRSWAEAHGARYIVAIRKTARTRQKTERRRV